MQPIIVSGSNPIFNQGQHLAFFGRSNVGKSSTINAILNNKSAAKTSARPGKTITFNFYQINNSTDRYLVDLPGYGYARYGEQFREKLRRRLIWYVTESKADIKHFCIVIDAKAGLTELDYSALDLALENKLDVIILVNKIDKLNQKEQSKLIKENDEILSEYGLSDKVIYYSAKTGRGIDKVRSALEI